MRPIPWCQIPCARWKASILPAGGGAFRSVGPALYIDCCPCSDSFMLGPNRYCGVFTALEFSGVAGWLPGTAGIGLWLNRRSKPAGEEVDCPKIAPMVPIAVGGGPGSGGSVAAAGSAGTGGAGSAAAVAAEATAVPTASTPTTVMVLASVLADVIRTSS